VRQLYFALSQANQAILRIRPEPALLRKICDIASEFGEFPLVWIGVRVPGGHELSIAARSGPEADYLDEITVSTDPESPFGRGQTGAAIRSGAPVVSNHLQRDPFMSPWREGARRHGFAASAAFPFRRAGQVAGALMVYSHHPGCFDLEGVALLGEIVDSLSFALDAMDAEAARQAAEEKFARIFQLCPDAIDLSQLEDGVSCDHNESYNRLYGYSREELAGRSTLPGDLGIWLSKEDRDRHIDLLKAQGTVRDYEAIQRRKDGSRFHASVSSTRLEIQGRAYNLTISRDITERKRLERERQQAQKMESLGTLAGGIAHDMNNVLGAILALASTSLSQLSAASPCRRSFETIAKAAERGGDMVRRLLSFARQTAHGDSPVDLNELCRDVVRLLEHTTLSSIHLRLELAAACTRCGATRRRSATP
jgi:PAS domain S-box-containing protein